MFQRTHAIILKRIPYGEADQIVTFFSHEAGRLSGIARASKKSLRRFGAALEPGTVLNLHYRHRPHMSLVELQSADILHSPLGIMKSLSRIHALSYALELSLEFLQEHQSEVQKFHLLKNYLISLTQEEPDDSSSIFFLYQWLSLSGYRPPAHLLSLSREGEKAFEGLLNGESVSSEGAEEIQISLLCYVEQVLGKPLRSRTCVF